MKQLSYKIIFGDSFKKRIDSIGVHVWQGDGKPVGGNGDVVLEAKIEGWLDA